MLKRVDGSWSLGSGRSALLLVVAAAGLVRIVLAVHKSLVLDEFHSWYHATRPDLRSFFGTLVEDNHPPLSFLLVGTARAAIGAHELALRSPAIVAGLVEIALVAGIARRAAGARASIFAALLLAASSMHMDYGTQARMYALLALAITAFVAAAIELIDRDAPPRGASATIALSATAAFHTHYFAVQYLAVLVAASGVAAAVSGRANRVRRFALPLGAAVALSLPWAWFGFRIQLGHALPPGGDDLGVVALLESYVHLFAHNLSFGGPTGRWFFAGAAAALLLIAARGALLALGAPASRTAGVLLGAAAFAVPAFAWGLAQVLPRAGFTWHYVLPSAAAAAALAGIGARGRAASIVATVALLLTATLGALHLVRPATEDFRGAVAYALRAVEGADPDEDVRVVSVEYQPALFPQGQPWDYYAPRLSATPPAREPMLEREFSVADPESLLAADRVVLVRRSVPDELFLMRALREAMGAPIDFVDFGYGVDVITFAR